MKKKKIIIALSILLLLVLMISTPIMAKYIISKQTQISITSDKFYFTTDLLGDTYIGDSLSKTYNLYGGDDKEVSFQVQNYYDDFRITGSDVKYDISYEVILPTGSTYDKSNVSLKVDDTLVNQTNGLKNITLTKNSKSSDKITLNVGKGTAGNEYSDKTTVVVTVESTSPYSKKMTLTFVFNTFESEFSYYIVDSVNSLYAELFVLSNVDIDVKKLKIDLSNVNSSSDVLLSDYTNTYLITDGVVPSYQSSKEVYNTVKINAGEAIAIKFFKTDISKDYSINEIKANSEGGIFNVIIPNS